MASIRREIAVAVAPEAAWNALRDFGSLHTRLAAGFVVDCRLDGDDRIVTFANGSVLRERLVSVDDERRRLVWTIVDGPYSHHNGAAEILEVGGETVFRWTSDLLPDALADGTAQAMERGLEAIRETLERPRADGG